MKMAFGECSQASDCTVHPTIHAVRERLERLQSIVVLILSDF